MAAPTQTSSAPVTKQAQADGDSISLSLMQFVGRDGNTTFLLSVRAPARQAAEDTFARAMSNNPHPETLQ
jgi:hypothetical protein